MREQNQSGPTELTGNHYLFLPDVRTDDAALGSVTALHRGLGGVLAWHGGEEPLLRPVIREDGAPLDLGRLRWERLDRWLPRFQAAGPRGLGVTGTVCAPGAWGGEVRGAVYLLELDNQAHQDREMEVCLDVRWVEARLGVQHDRALDLPRRLLRHVEGGALVLEVGSGAGGGAALALAGPAGTSFLVDGAELAAGQERSATGGQALAGSLSVPVRVRARARVSVAFHLAVAPERDGAAAGTRRLRRIGAAELVRHARLELTSLLRAPRQGEWAGVLNRNLLLAYYGTVARALDDDRPYLVAGRDPGAGPSGVFTERDGLLWTLPAISLLDAPLAREAMLSALELHAQRAGQGVRYMDGGLLAPGLSTASAALWPVAIERYARDTGDTSLFEDPLVQELLRDLDGMLAARLHPEIFLAGTETLLSGQEADHPFAILDNALLAAAADAMDRLRRPTEGEPPARLHGAGEEIRAAVWQHGTVPVAGEAVLASSVDLEGAAAVYDDPDASLALLPELGFCDPEDPVWSASMAFLRGADYELWSEAGPVAALARRDRPAEGRLAAVCADLLGPRRAEALRALAALRAPDGFAREAYDPATGELVGSPRPALAGLLGWTLARVLGEKPPGGSASG